MDEPPRLVAFTVKQWALLIAGSAAVLGVIHLARVPTKPAITLCVFVIGLPAALTYVSENGGLQLGVLLREMIRWRVSPQQLAPAADGSGTALGILVLPAPDPPVRRVEEASGQKPLLDELSWERWG
ncbi:MAG TPA: hypothetical protein VN618_09445 [Solirubrobacteraceae bacterium]|nr:hypothetical protein [Solirubrobacteraceae bacterium]